MLCLAGPAGALELPGGALPVAAEREPVGSAEVAVGPFDGQRIDTVAAEGRASIEAWRLSGSDLTTLQIIAPLRAQLIEDGYEVLYECADTACGGFDFRFGLEVLPAPEMYVDLGDFRYLSARRELDDGAEYVALLASRSPSTGFVQITRVAPPGAGELQLTTSTKAAGPVASAPTPPEGLVRRLLADGRAPLEDLTFEVGSARLGDDDFPSLRRLADFLKDDDGRSVVLVGHTDTQGTLAGNIALSQRRAQSVADRLIDTYGVPAGQVSAEGVGFLAPRAANDTAEGRRKNRRVEVILSQTR